MSSNSDSNINDEKKSPIVRTVRCPQCGRPAVYSAENKFRPFCSERCKLIDLGQWADEAFRIPVEKNPHINDDDIPEEDGENY